VSLHHFPPDAPVSEISDHLRQWGYAIVHNVVDDATMDRLEAEARPWIDRSAHGRDEYDGQYTRRTGALIARCPTARELVMNPTVVGTVQHFLSHVTAVQLHLTQIISIEPGETQQKLHRDQMAFDFFPFPADYHPQCNSMWALTDFTAENGATRLVPGSHRSDHAPDLTTTYDSIPAEMRRGSVLIWDGALWHGGGANSTDADRIGIAMNYCAGYIRQQENQQLGIPRAVAATFPTRLRRLVGYSVYSGLIGHIDRRDPVELLDEPGPAGPSPMVWDAIG